MDKQRIVYCPPVDRVMSIFKKLNAIPRPSHHEEKVADFLCQYAQSLGLEYQRDTQNCVIIRKPATPGHEDADPIVVLNHMDMVCVGMDNPLVDTVKPKVDGDWMTAEGTSLGADNGVGLSMALAMLADDAIVHGPIEVMTTTNEEDGMTGAEALAPDFIKGRKVVNLDSEDYDTITTGAAGALLQQHRLPAPLVEAPQGKRRWFKITITGGKGGHSGVDIAKGRASAVTMAWAVLAAIYNEYDIELARIDIGEANASIASKAVLVITVPSGEPAEYVKAQEESFNQWVSEEYRETDPDVRCSIEKVNPMDEVIEHEAFHQLMTCLENLPQGVVKMSETIEGTPETSNNVGRVYHDGENIVVTTHTRSFINDEMEAVAADIANVMAEGGADSQTLMMAPAWQEDAESPFIKLTSDVFDDVLGWRPRMVAMHFVLEAGYLVQKFPGMQIASIGPRIVEPHSTSERVQLSTIDDIWKVFINLLARLA
ncbi:MAG: beta-Ala-His dipeptidase [Prevotella sp.]|nr:beta-Ala-His dipeptidase [Prevotella sp.]